MFYTLQILFTFLFFCCFFGCQSKKTTKISPPIISADSSKSYEIFGTEIYDVYHAFDSMQNSTKINWQKKQNEYTNTILDSHHLQLAVKDSIYYNWTYDSTQLNDFIFEKFKTSLNNLLSSYQSDTIINFDLRPIKLTKYSKDHRDHLHIENKIKQQTLATDTVIVDQRIAWLGQDTVNQVLHTYWWQSSIRVPGRLVDVEMNSGVVKIVFDIPFPLQTPILNTSLLFTTAESGERIPVEVIHSRNIEVHNCKAILLIFNDRDQQNMSNQLQSFMPLLDEGIGIAYAFLPNENLLHLSDQQENMLAVMDMLNYVNVADSTKLMVKGSNQIATALLNIIQDFPQKAKAAVLRNPRMNLLNIESLQANLFRDRFFYCYEHSPLLKPVTTAHHVPLMITVSDQNENKIEVFKFIQKWQQFDQKLGTQTTFLNIQNEKHSNDEQKDLSSIELKFISQYIQDYKTLQ